MVVKYLESKNYQLLINKNWMTKNLFVFYFKRILSTGLFVLCFFNLYAQPYDANWLLGYDGANGIDTNWGITQIHFYNLGKKGIVNNQNTKMWITHTNGSISNKIGELLYYTNGQYVENRLFKLLQNGGNINVYDDNGDNGPQAVLFLPFPENESQTLMFNGEFTILPALGWEMVALKHSIIDLNLNNGNGAITLKNNYLIKDTLSFGRITATKHANGRDWWVLVSERNKNSFYRYLITPQGVIEKAIQKLQGNIGDNGVGQACFSPDGSKYAIFNYVDLTTGQFFDIYDFDRCTGLLSNHKYLHNYNMYVGGGLAISPNSKYAYFIDADKIFQVDLTSEEPLENLEVVATYDGFIDIFHTRFFLAQLAPDGKIYIGTPGSPKWLHVIEYPDRKGTACNVKQHSFPLYTYSGGGIPNFPNYRLGPIDGSACDTLGIDNLPIANFRADQDASVTLKFEFNDLSYYEPTNWSWDFGDGSFSSDTSPIHLFPKNGKYVVCLTVSNQFGSNTACDTLYLGVDPSATYNLQDIQVSVYPNPATDYINFIMNDYYPTRAIIRLFDQKGIKLIEQGFKQGWNSVDVRDLVGGVYLYEVVDENLIVNKGKVLVVR